MKNKELKLAEGQLIGTFIYILVLIISALILYNQCLSHQNKKTIFKEKTVQNLNIMNRIIVLLVVLYFLYTNLENKKMTKEKNKDLTNQNLQCIASFITVIAALIVLYVSFEEYYKSIIPISSVENPNL